jgi:hypothetical protein
MIYDANEIGNQVTDNGQWRRKEGGRKIGINALGDDVMIYY